MAFAIKKEHLPHYTYDDYCKWEGRWELIEGVPYAQPPLTILHQDVLGNILLQVDKALNESKQCRVYMAVGWKINDYILVQPDISVINQLTKLDEYPDFPPVLIFEIVSPSTSLRDRKLKLEFDFSSIWSKYNFDSVAHNS